jgi:4'-phosphopantetheinyl transferase
VNSVPPRIDIWTVRLDASELPPRELIELLSPDEQNRMQQFKFEHRQHAFALSRAALRILLAQRLPIAPRAIEFVYGPYGKPRVEHPSLRFNSSHTSELFACALNEECDIGIDIERTKPLPDAEQIARSYFCPEEVAEFVTLGSEQQEAAFFRCWTRKEAFLKATGTGLSTDLNSFGVTLLPNDPPAFVHVHHSKMEARQWTLQDLSDIPGHTGAVAYRHSPLPLQQHETLTAEDLLKLLPSGRSRS